MSDEIPRGERVQVDEATVARLIAEQFPRWAQLPVRPVALSGWDNHTFRLGDAMKVRLPASAGYLAQTEKETSWLPRLAPYLPVPGAGPARRREPRLRLPVPVVDLGLDRRHPGHRWTGLTISRASPGRSPASCSPCSAVRPTVARAPGPTALSAAVT